MNSLKIYIISTIVSTINSIKNISWSWGAPAVTFISRITNNKKILSDKLNKYYGASLDFPDVKRTKLSRDISFDI